MPHGETAQHLQLKRLALIWARANGYALSAAEVSLPHLRFRLDVAAYRCESRSEDVPGSLRRRRAPVAGTTVVFECKQCRADFLKDSRNSEPLREELARLDARKARHEAALKLFHPSLRNGDSLFAEYESHDFGRSGDELYLKLLARIATVSRQLYGQTKFEKLTRWNTANLYYVVTEPGVLSASELPHGWGLLVRVEGELQVAVKPLWHDSSEASRLTMLERIAAAGTRVVHRAAGIDWNSREPVLPSAVR